MPSFFLICDLYAFLSFLETVMNPVGSVGDLQEPNPARRVAIVQEDSSETGMEQLKTARIRIQPLGQCRMKIFSPRQEFFLGDGKVPEIDSHLLKARLKLEGDPTSAFFDLGDLPCIRFQAGREVAP